MACLGFTYGCFAGLSMAWPFGAIVGSNCGCDRHPVSSLDPLSILQTILPHDRCHVAWPRDGPDTALRLKEGHRRVAFVFVNFRPGKIHEAPSAAIYSGRVLEPRESCCTSDKDDTGSGWSCLWVGMSNSRQFSVTVDKPDRTLRSRPKQDAGNPEFANDSIPFPCLLRRMVHPFAGPR